MFHWNCRIGWGKTDGLLNFITSRHIFIIGTKAWFGMGTQNNSIFTQDVETTISDRHRRHYVRFRGGNFSSHAIRALRPRLRQPNTVLTKCSAWLLFERISKYCTKQSSSTCTSSLISPLSMWSLSQDTPYKRTNHSALQNLTRILSFCRFEPQPTLISYFYS